MKIDRNVWGRSPMMFMDGDDGGGGGGESQGMSVFEGDEPQQQAEPEPQPQQQPEPSGPSFVDARHLAQEFGHVIGQHFQPPPKEMSIEEAKQLLNVWEPTKEWLARYEDPETRNQALAEQRDGLIRQADTIMRYRMSELQSAMEQKYAPVVQYMQQQEAQAGEYRFAQYFPQLNQAGLRPLLFSVAQSLLASGTRFRSEPELFTAIARGVESVIKVSNPQFSLESNGGGAGAVPQQQKRTGHTAGRLPVTTPGAGGGGMKGPGPPKPRGLAIFDP